MDHITAKAQSEDTNVCQTIVLKMPQYCVVKSLTIECLAPHGCQASDKPETLTFTVEDAGDGAYAVISTESFAIDEYDVDAVAHLSNALRQLHDKVSEISPN